MEADFQRFYGRDLRVEVEWCGARRLYALVKYLPPDAAIWRSQKESLNGNNTTVRAKGADDIRRFFDEHIERASSDSGGVVFPPV